jgi:AcrR family transcriptional regulator
MSTEPLTNGVSARTSSRDNGERATPSRMPRPARRAQLLQAAREVFVAQGYHAAAMDDIAERAGVSKPVLYQHFPGKMELYLALLETHTNELVQQVKRALESTTDNKVRVHQAVEAYYEFVDNEDGSFRLVFETDLGNDPAVRELVDRGNRVCAEAIADTIAADTGLPREHAELLATGLIGAAQVSARSWLATDRAVPKAEAIELMAGVSWRGISGFPRHG